MPFLAGIPIQAVRANDKRRDIVSLCITATTSRVSRITMLPDQLDLLLAHSIAWTSLKYVFVSGAPLYKHTAEKFIATYPTAMPDKSIW